MNSSSHINGTMEEIRDEYFKVIIPVLVLSVFTMTVGTLGNCLVLYIFKFKYRQSNHRYFIICLAACDLTGSLIGIPFLIAEMTLTYFYGTTVCKISRYLSHFLGFCSACIIMIIAIERYLKICKANGKQMSSNMARRFNLKVSKCHYQDTYKDTFFPLMYQAFLLLWFILAMITTCACYAQIACRFRTRNAAQNIICQCVRIKNSLDSLDTSSGRCNQLALKGTVINKSKSEIKAYRLAKMLFIVAAVYLCSYIPYFGASLDNITEKKFLRSLVERASILVCLKSFLINYFANPIVYGLLDRAFRAECQNLFYRIIIKY
ncbi:hypothetical protein ACJMK2_032787 [Sinanodonta woodiana]|uniref:G-protein coupled receptors family 1 profile domain-containing protein n=1 Tax=Sinanodonta woodiana TaxID=1069815 RepID=A0ABD3X4R0_SINWO